MRPHEELLTACELLDAPDHRVGVGHVFYVAHVGLENGRVDIGRHGNDDLHVVRDGLGFELSLSFDQVLDLGATEILNNTVSPNQRLDVRVQSISHQIELTIRRDERDVALLLELIEAYALMELDVLHLDKFASCRAILHLEKHFVVQSELKLWHPAQKAAHVNAPKNLRPEHVAIGTDEDVQTLNYVKEYLILCVSNTFRAPRDDVTRSCRHDYICDLLWFASFALLAAFTFHLVRLGLDIFFQNFDFSDLRIAIVHHLVKELVSDDEVVSQRLILQLAEVRRQHLLHPVKEGKDEGDVWVTARNRHNVNVIDANPNEGRVTLGEDWLQGALVKL